jgi:small subunit ribosomal protein S20
MKNVIKSLEEAIRTNSPDLARERLAQVVSVIDKTAQKGVIHRNKASRRISRLTMRVNALLKA